MTYAATAIARTDAGWTGDEIELDDVEDLDGVIEAVCDLVGDDASPALLFVEENDEWFGVLRLDAVGEPRVFVSDARVISSSDTAALLGEAAIDVEPAEDDVGDGDSDEASDDEEEDATPADGDPAGDPALLADLGTPADRLLRLCAKEGQLPSDIITELCDAAGCLDVLERVRGE